MKLIDQYPVYELGGALQSLKDALARESATAIEQLIALYGADGWLKSLLQGHPVEISYSRDAAIELQRYVQTASEPFRDTETGRIRADPQKLESWASIPVRNAIEKFEHQFSAELKKMPAYAVPRRGIFDTERLVDAAEQHLPESIRKNLPHFVLSEFRSAGRCLAFGLNSASAFHALRASECALRQYYVAFLGEPKKEELTMGQMASHLNDRAQAKNSAPKPNITSLRIIQDVTTFDRNPLTHKELELTEDEATMLFNRAQGMIAVTSKEIIDRTDELHPNLPLVEKMKEVDEPSIQSAKKPVAAIRARNKPISSERGTDDD